MKKFWSLLAILMVSVLSFGFVSCDDDDDKKDETGNYFVEAYISDQGDLDTYSVNMLSEALNNTVGDIYIEKANLSDAKKAVKAGIEDAAPSIAGFLDDCTFEVTVNMYQEAEQNEKVVASWVVAFKEGSWKIK
ncbi:MAG: hypothetical protein J6032_08825 [Bacteroidales bacterium]|nr:hypothetical protein [Bacteroidales bacterium]